MCGCYVQSTGCHVSRQWHASRAYVDDPVPFIAWVRFVPIDRYWFRCCLFPSWGLILSGHTKLMYVSLYNFWFCNNHSILTVNFFDKHALNGTGSSPYAGRIETRAAGVIRDNHCVYTGQPLNHGVSQWSDAWKLLEWRFYWCDGARPPVPPYMTLIPSPSCQL